MLLASTGHDVYVVGGAVRDLLLGNPPKDFDLLTTAQPHQVSACSATPIVVHCGCMHSCLHSCDLIISSGDLMSASGIIPR